MKTAISIPDDIFASADSLAARLGISRSQLYASAVAEYVAKHRGAKVTERLNTVYATESSQLDPALRRAQRRAAKRATW
jgi:metal-responsive CopG/Arc/MetJ family transcriptional regulator